MNSVGIALALGVSVAPFCRASGAATAFLDPYSVSAYWLRGRSEPSTLDAAVDFNGTRPAATTDGIAGDRTAELQDELQLSINSEGKDVSGVITLWHPGLGSCCHGIWSPQWTGASNVKNDLIAGLNATARPLAERINNHECPYGRALPGDVTWRGSIPKELRGIVAPQTALTVIAVVYSYLPFVVAFVVIVDLVLRRGTRQASLAVWLLVIMLLNEVVFKHLLLHPRPGTMLQMRDSAGFFVGSCVQKCGMPSSHAALAFGWLTLLLCDAAHRVHPQATDQELITPVRPSDFLSRGLAWVHNYHATVRGGEERSPTTMKKICKICTLVLLTPFMPYGALTYDEYMAFLVFWSLIWLPVPFMRVVLYDHTIEQCLVGCIVGAITAAAWWRVVRKLQRKYESRVNDTFCRILKHNYPYPHFMARKQKEMVDGSWEVRVDASPVRVEKIERGVLLTPEGAKGPPINFMKSDIKLTFWRDIQGQRATGTLTSFNEIQWDNNEFWYRTS
eukprot:CAMPEP_0115272112 /NCGR_PEP_ID=MMETSP0270-20121206/54453_1 /TAXON_ID=71861 /ORGANISM="Scrippsiella trochoidea, Strain CCMP3099" /LENGTH=504 /DNA_ID=CAMNT_0002688505 /DNA_START=35 /DNA_END=1549 /DNA_ORIENTATION=-